MTREPRSPSSFANHLPGSHAMAVAHYFSAFVTATRELASTCPPKMISNKAMIMCMLCLCSLTLDQMLKPVMMYVSQFLISLTI